MAAFDGEVLGHVGRWLAPMRLNPDVTAEVTQSLRVKFFVGPDPKLLGYRGAGPLGAWARMSAVRAALDVLAAQPDTVDDSKIEVRDPAALFGNAEKELIRRRYGATFEQAIVEAVTALTDRQRALLRFNYVAGISVEAIGRVYGVSKATASRWLIETREELESSVTTRVWELAGVSPSEFHSIWGLLGSALNLSLSKILRPADAGPAS